MTTIELKASTAITVRVLKYDGAEHRHWSAKIALREGRLIVLDAEFDYDVQHHLLGEIPRGTRTIEYYWLDRWYNVFQFMDNEGKTRLYYCNVSAPPKLEGDVLSYVDLDIDLLVQPDLSYQLLDTEEFETNAGRWGYSAETRRQALAAVAELESMIAGRQFPFSQVT
jgi:protein associated with RNAse G/E